MAVYTDEVTRTFKLPVMTLEVQSAGETLTFKSPVAETILDQIKKIAVGEGVVQYFDADTNEFKSLTFCCGDKYKFTYEAKEYQALATELDCYGFPITYEGDK